MVGALRAVWNIWKRVAKRIGEIQARVLLLLFYFIVFGPAALLVRLRSDPLALKAGARRGWRTVAELEGSALERASRQF